jgi:hypothetical protein
MKIFVSATSNGLKTYRESVVESLDALGQTHREQRDLHPDYRTIVNILKSKIAECEVVICLIGPAYGTAPNDQLPGGPPRSYAQIEYETACELQKRVYILCPSEDCVLDDFTESTGDNELQQRFLDRVKAENPAIRGSFKNKESLHLEIAAIVTEGLTRVEVDAFPTPFAKTLHELQNRRPNELQTSFELLVALLGCIGSADARRHGSGDNGQLPSLDLKKSFSLLHRLSSRPADETSAFIPELSVWLSAHMATIDQRAQDLVAKSNTNMARARYAEHVKRWQDFVASFVMGLEFLGRYVLASVHFNPGAELPMLRLYRGVNTDDVVKLVWADNAHSHITEGSVLMLSLNSREALCLSPYLVPYHANPRYLCVAASAETRGRLEVCPLGNEEDRYEVEQASPEFFGWRGSLFQVSSWDLIVGKYPSREATVVGPGFRPIGPPKHRGKLCDLYLATGGDAPPGRFALVHVLREKADEKSSIRKWFKLRLDLWKKLAASGAENIIAPLESSNCAVDAENPFIAMIEQEGKPLGDILSRSRHLKLSEAVEVVRAAIGVCQAADSIGIRLLTLHPRHILMTSDDSKCLFAGFDTIASADCVLPDTETLRGNFGGLFDDLAPEITDGKRCPKVTSDIFAIGTLLQRLQDRPSTPLPPGTSDREQDEYMVGEWRSDLLSCFAFHCLAQDPNRRFQSVAQCSKFLDKCIQQGSASVFVEPEIVQIEEGLFVSRFPIMNYEFECYCRDWLRTSPTLLLNRRFCGPFAPVVYVTYQDAVAYTEWLTQHSRPGRQWRLPTDDEWTRAATGGSLRGSSYPWGDIPPTPEHANFCGIFSGPTVVGSFAAGRSISGCEDLAGNVWEWCADHPTERPRRVTRGGGYGSSEQDLAFPLCESRLFGRRYDDVGFRVVCNMK